MRSLQAAVVTACVVLLAGCDDTPSNSMTDAQNKKVAETEAWVPSIKVVDFGLFVVFIRWTSGLLKQAPGHWHRGTMAYPGC